MEPSSSLLFLQRFNKVKEIDTFQHLLQRLLETNLAGIISYFPPTTVYSSPVFQHYVQIFTFLSFMFIRTLYASFQFLCVVVWNEGDFALQTQVDIPLRWLE